MLTATQLDDQVKAVLRSHALWPRLVDHHAALMLLPRHQHYSLIHSAVGVLQFASLLQDAKSPQVKVRRGDGKACAQYWEPGQHPGSAVVQVGRRVCGLLHD